MGFERSKSILKNKNIKNIILREDSNLNQIFLFESFMSTLLEILRFLESKCYKAIYVNKIFYIVLICYFLIIINIRLLSVEIKHNKNKIENIKK